MHRDNKSYDEPANVLERISERLEQLSASEARVAQFIMNNTQQAILLSSARIASLTGTSDTTVVRMSRVLGFSGWAELKRSLGSQIVFSTHPAKRLATRLTVTRNASASELAKTVFEEAIERLAITVGDLDAESFTRALDLLSGATRVFVYGVGRSHLSAEYMSSALVRIGRDARPLRAMGFALADELLPLAETDVLVLFAPGRPFTELDVAFAHAGQLGVRSILVTGRYSHDYDDRADCVLHVAGSAGGLTGEILTASVAVDALVLALGQKDIAKATESSRQLNRLRRALVRRRRASPREEGESSKPTDG